VSDKFTDPRDRDIERVWPFRRGQERSTVPDPEPGILPTPAELSERGFAARPQEILASLDKLPCHFCHGIGGNHLQNCPVLLAKETMEQYRGEVKTTTGNVPAEGANPAVDHPAHYNQHPSGVECIDIVRWMGFNLGNVVKYLWRDGLKNTEVELQDLEKAAWYLNNEINRRKANGTE